MHIIVRMRGADPTYEIRLTLVIDRPELRDSTFRPVKPGTRTFQTWTYHRQSAAVQVFEEMLAGRWDFSSEYIASASVVQRRSNASPRTVRRRVDRERIETSRQRRMAMLAVGGARRRGAIGADGWLYTRNIIELPVPMPAAPAELVEVPLAA